MQLRELVNKISSRTTERERGRMGERGSERKTTIALFINICRICNQCYVSFHFHRRDKYISIKAADKYRHSSLASISHLATEPGPWNRVKNLFDTHGKRQGSPDRVLGSILGRNRVIYKRDSAESAGMFAIEEKSAPRRTLRLCKRYKSIGDIIIKIPRCCTSVYDICLS